MKIRTIALVLLSLFIGLSMGCEKKPSQDTEKPSQDTPAPIRGENYVEDGINQNTLISMENVYYKDGFVYYTLVNQTSGFFSYSDKPYVERLVGDKWIRTTLYTSTDVMNLKIGGFQTKECCFEVDAFLRAEGEYRLSFGDRGNCNTDENGDFQYAYNPNIVYAVGYLTIGEGEGVLKEPIEKIKLEAQVLLQSDGMYLQYSIKNNATHAFETDKIPHLQRYEKGRNGNYHFEDVDVFFGDNEKCVIEAGACAEHELPIYAEKYDETLISSLAPGRYRIYLLPAAVSSKYGVFYYEAFAYFTVTEAPKE